jgi:hypothetical protein
LASLFGISQCAGNIICIEVDSHKIDLKKKGNFWLEFFGLRPLGFENELFYRLFTTRWGTGDHDVLFVVSF